MGSAIVPIWWVDITSWWSTILTEQNYPESGSFAEFALVKDGHIAKLPQNVTFEEAATLGTGLTAVGQALYMIMQLPLPTKPAKEPYFILISGGSSATGTLAIQFAKLFVTLSFFVTYEFTKCADRA
jgi:NADPH:quinone reductase-like Zn-dependent oxidoreductase